MRFRHTVTAVALLFGCGQPSSPPGGANYDLSEIGTVGAQDLSTRSLSDFAGGASLDFAVPTGSDLTASTTDLAHQPSFQNDVMPILTSHGCLSHHMTAAWNGVENVSGSAAIIAYLSSNASSQCSGDKFVAAGDATNSYLYQKVSGNFASPCATSDTMPFGAGPLPTSESDVIRAWINAGAANN